MGNFRIPTRQIEELNPAMIKGLSRFQAVRELTVGVGNRVMKASHDGLFFGSKDTNLADAWIDLAGSAVFKKLKVSGLQVGSDIDGQYLQDGTVPDAKIITLAATKITSQIVNAQIATIDWAKITSVVIHNADIADLNANKITSQIVNSQIATIEYGKITSVWVLNANIANLNADKINAGTLTGRDVRSSSATSYILLSNGNFLQFVRSGVEKGRIWSDDAGDIYIRGTDDVIFNAGGAIRCGVHGTAFKPHTDNVYDLGTTDRRWDKLYATYGKFADVTIDGDSIYPSSASGHYCGTSGNHWGEVYTNGCTGCAYKEFNLLTKEQKKRHKKKNKIDDYKIGQVLVIKMDKEELEPCNKSACDCVIGVGSNNGVPIVLGAEPVQVSGKVRKGQRLVTSIAFGRARGLREGERVRSGAVFARALEDKGTEDNGVIKAFINITN